MAADRTIKAVFFDVGNTLVFPDWEVFLEPLRAAGTAVPDGLVREVEREAKPYFDSLVLSDAPESHDKSYWQIFFAMLLQRLGRPDDGLVAQMCQRSRNSANWSRVQPGTEEALRRIGERYRIAVISNADGKIEACLRNAGVCPPFETITDSGVVGVEKPDPRIFQAALESLGVTAEESLYVGDVYSVDYLGAQNAGMQALLMDVNGAYAGKGYERVVSLAELEDRLTADS